MNPFNMGLPDNPIQCPDDLDYLSSFNEHLLNNNPNNEPSDDWDYLQHIKSGKQYAPYSRKEIKECQFEVKQRLADQAAHNAEVDREVERMRKFYANRSFS